MCLLTGDRPGAEATPKRPAAGRVAWRTLLGVPEFRGVLLAQVLSALGDQLNKVAVSILVFHRTGSAWLTAFSYAISYLPWIVGGPVLGALGDRLPRRRVMIACDLARMVLVAVLALPGLPIPATLVVLLVASMFAPPFSSARSALITEILEGDAYVVGNSLTLTAYQACNVIGFLVGGVLVAAIGSRGALLIDAITFGVSAVMVAAWIRPRPASITESATVTSDIAGGLTLVLTDVRLRTILWIVCLGASGTFAWEGIAAPWAAQLGGGSATTGLLLGISAAGTVAGGLVLTRLSGRARAIVLMPANLVAPLITACVFFAPNLAATLVILVVSGFTIAFTQPLNAIYMQSLPADARSRGFGVAQGALQASQGIAYALAGVVAGVLTPRTSAAIFALGAVVFMAPAVVRLPPELREMIRPRALGSAERAT